MATLPPGLEPYYHSHLSLMKSADTEKYLSLQEPIICFLARAREPVTVREISAWMLGAGFTAGEERRVRAVLTREMGPVHTDRANRSAEVSTIPSQLPRLSGKAGRS